MEKDIFMIENKTILYHIINVGDGINYRKSVYPFWGLSGNARVYVKTFMNIGDILWFCQDFGEELKVIGMAEYTHRYDIADEPLIHMNIVEREKQNWDSTVSNDIQIYYKEVYDTYKQDINIKKIDGEIFTYSTDYGEDLYKHYSGFKFYGKTKDI